ncbi:MMPL family transporter [Streptomyces sp. KS 21]|uniref:MMPL family transporter n=1 Tax=Streptomyces sp. KS 21 TaxID=2485150 RepID=UPI0010632A35|nr:MMPL family transporter [Streptomyces sp. KS 21]
MTDRPRRVLGVAALLTVLLAVGGAFASAGLSTGGFTASGTESARVQQALAQQFGVHPASLLLRIQGDVDSPSVAAKGARLTQRLAGEPGVAHAVSYWTTGAPELRADDGHAALIAIDLSGDETQAEATAAHLVARAREEAKPLDLSAAGPAWMSVQATEQNRTDLTRAELLAAPLTVLILLLAFGSPTAAVLPVIIGVLAVTASSAVLSLLTRVMTISLFATNIITALGFGLAVDYALFVVTRFREEHSRGESVSDAVAAAMRTAGRGVLFSAVTVALALAAMFVFPLPFLRSMACASIAVVLLSALASVTALPALLILLGARITRATPPMALIRRLRSIRRSHGTANRQPHEPGTSATWRRIAETATARPVLLAGTCTLLLLALAIPFSHVRFGFSDERDLPARLESHAIGDRLRHDFPAPANLTLTVLLPTTDPQRDAAELSRYAQHLADTPGVAFVEAATGTFTPGTAATAPTRHSQRFAASGATWLAVIGRPSANGNVDDALVRRIRQLPAPGPHLVGGLPAEQADTLHALGTRVPGALSIAAVSTFVLLFFFSRSLLIPFKAVIIAALSLTACLGAMVFVFQDGHLRWLVGEFAVTGQLNVIMALLALVIAFGLSVDYQVFLLSRIQEEYQRTGDHTESIISGIARTGRLVTAAALVVATAMGALATSGVTPLKVLGFGLALAVLTDATLVRGLLVPAVMQLTGKANWWTPAVLAHRSVSSGQQHGTAATAAPTPRPPEAVG